MSIKIEYTRIASFLATICMIAMTLPVAAQDEIPAEKPLTIAEGSHLTVSFSTGYTNLMVNSENLKKSPGGFGLGVEIDYTHFVSNHIGLRLGCDISLATSSYSMESYSTTSSENVNVWTNIERGESMTVKADYRTMTSGIRSEYTYTSVGIPVALAFQGEHWYAAAGAKFHIPLKLHEHSTYGETHTECVSIGNNQVSIPTANIKSQSVNSMSYDCASRGNTFKPFFVTSLIEGGYRVGRSRGDAICIGVYAEFAFNECHPDGKEALVARTDGKIVVSPSLKSDAIKSMRYVNAGLKFQYDFSFRHPRKR